MQDEDAHRGKLNAMRRHVPGAVQLATPSVLIRHAGAAPPSPPPPAHVGTQCQSNKAAPQTGGCYSAA